MKAYIASSFSLVPKVVEVARELEHLGYEITVKWWSVDGFNLVDKKNDLEHPENFYDDPICCKIFNRDFDGVKEADIFVLVADDVPKSFNGANIELGIALAEDIPCYSVGKLENSALYYKVKKHKTIPSLIDALKFEGAAVVAWSTCPHCGKEIVERDYGNYQTYEKH